MLLEAPQLIYLSLTFVGLGAGLVLHGKPKEGHHSFGIHLVSSAICLGLLYWGGFFG